MNISVFKVNQLGDAVCFLPVLQQLALSPKISKLTVWTTPAAFPVLAFSPKIHFHQMPLSEFNGAWKRPIKLAQILSLVRKAHPTACLLDSDQGNVAHLAAAISGAKICIGGISPAVKLNRLLNERIGYRSGTSYSQWCWDIGKKFAHDVLDESWELTPPPPDLSHLGLEQFHDKFEVLIHPGASRVYKQWPTIRFLDLAHRLSRKYRVAVVRPRELPDFEVPEGVTKLEPTSISELVSRIRSSSLFVGNNSGPMNLSAALGVSTLFISGPSREMWDPTWQNSSYEVLRRTEMPCICCDENFQDSNCHNILEPFGCLTRWSIDEVYLRCEKMLSLERNAHSSNF